MTKIDNLDSISKLGLIPRNGDNSKLIHDDKIKVFFSEGYEGAIALYVDFSIVYHQVKKKEIILNDDYLTNKIMSSKNLEDYLEDGVYLSFDMNGITNERNFENGCTSQVIEPENLNVLVLKNMETALNAMKRGAGVPHVSGETLSNVMLHIPALQEQQRVVNILDRFDTLCNDLSEGLPAEIEARRKQYEYYRDKLLSFEELQKK